MEEEVCYSSVVFTKSEEAKPREELNAEETVYDEVKKKEVQAECSLSPTTEEQNAEESVYAEVDKREVPSKAGPMSSLSTVSTAEDPSLSSFHRYRCAAVVLSLLTALFLFAFVAVLIYYGIYHMSEYNTVKVRELHLLRHKDVKCAFVKMHNAHLKSSNEMFQALYANASAANQLLMMERDRLNQTLQVIFQFNDFPVDHFCPVTHSSTQVRKCKGHCIKGYVHHQSSCYLFVDYLYWNTWEDSKTDCGKRGAHLVTIDTVEEQAFINNHTRFYYDKWHGYWIGLSKIQRRWQWVNGSELNGGYWISTGYDNCVASMPSIDPSKSWMDKSCTMRNRWICEMEAVTWPD